MGGTPGIGGPGSPAQQLRRDERGGLDRRSEWRQTMVDHLTCESLRSVSPSVHVRGLALCLPPLPAFTVPKFVCEVSSILVDHLTCESLRSCFPTQVELQGRHPGLPFWAGLQLQI
ncbi:unnamed protein product [Pleuronectes platessa]|uniref:Uncharacterized protein n=1 Tax=Pleuronectes platessa TaxID=8262 RepID=A0A9N7VVJ7_PLEPL|nr:unnamed protein product [Pleuronectes platessa]CAB1459081.1 unnamed protein product [Pleuronectes platessa]